MAGTWDSACAFEAEKRLAPEAAGDLQNDQGELHAFKISLVDRDGKSVAFDFPDQADMCWCAR